jgi:hypothetical protein
MLGADSMLRLAIWLLTIAIARAKKRRPMCYAEK